MKCPKCGTAKRLRPAQAPTEPEIDEHPDFLPDDDSEHEESNELSHRDRRGSWFGRIPLVKKLMLLVTGFWPCFGAFFTITTASGKYANFRHVNGMAWSPRYTNGQFVTPEEAWSMCLTAGIVPGVMLSTLIYGALMFVLFVVWFATKPSDVKP